MKSKIPRGLLVSLILVFGMGILHAQQPGVNCAPIQGQGWTGCAPIYPSQQSSQRQQPQPPQPLQPLWASQWGALAGDPTQGSLGTVTDMPSQSSAEQAAIADCISKGGLTCKIQLSYHDQCSAMLASPKGFNSAHAATVGIAIQIGMKTCTDAGDTQCQVVYSACSFPIRIQ